MRAKKKNDVCFFFACCDANLVLPRRGRKLYVKGNLNDEKQAFFPDGPFVRLLAFSSRKSFFSSSSSIVVTFRRLAEEGNID